MKKTIITSCVAMMLAFASFAQPVSDRAVVPVAVTLNQVLRLHVINGGNIEFVFNTIEQYKSGVANSAFYNTDFVIASSTDWEMYFGAEDLNLMGTDENAPTQNTMPLDNIGFMVVNNSATYTFGPNGGGTNTELGGALSDADAAFNGLEQFPSVGNSPLLTVGTNNGGDINDNSFTINWNCGITPSTGLGTPTNGTTILSQNLNPDRYVTNVFLDIESL